MRVETTEDLLRIRKAALSLPLFSVSFYHFQFSYAHPVILVARRLFGKRFFFSFFHFSLFLFFFIMAPSSFLPRLFPPNKTVKKDTSKKPLKTTVCSFVPLRRRHKSHAPGSSCGGLTQLGLTHLGFTPPPGPRETLNPRN